MQQILTGAYLRRYAVVVVTALVLGLCLPAVAQESTVKGNLGGTVYDATGAVIPNAKVKLAGPTESRTVTSDGTGNFMFSVLTPGFYSVKVEMQGFKSAELKSVEVLTNRTSNIRFDLQPGAVAETVEVSASAVTVDVATTAVSANLSDTFYSQVPLQRNVTGLFYAGTGVNQGGATGAANPSISGGSGLENQYIADGVNITDGAFGGIGVYSLVYGSLATGINLSFVKEVQVKTEGYEPQYGKATGGVVQIVTKSGSRDYHGAISAFFGPQQLEATRLQPDNFGRFNLIGKTLHQGAYDVAGEVGGYVPGLRDKVFFFGSFNPSWSRDYDQLSTLHGLLNYPLVGSNQTLKQLSYNYSTKLTYKLNDSHQLEASIFGDPTRTGMGPFSDLATFSDTTFSKLSYGTRNFVTRYNATLSPSWLFNASFSWGHNYFNEGLKSPGTFGIADLTGRGSGTSPDGPLGPMTGQYQRQGVGYTESTAGDNYGLSFDTQKVAHKLGEHTFSVGYHYERNYYAGTRLRSGGLYTVPSDMIAEVGDPSLTAGAQNDFDGQLRTYSWSPVQMFVPGFGTRGVGIYQTRGEFGNPAFNTHGRYHAAYVNDSWTPVKYVTMNIGWRWEQQSMTGTKFVSPLDGLQHQPHYTFTDNWSPRIGLSIDPIGNRKTKIFGNFARYDYAIPLRMAIRSLSNEMDLSGNLWLPAFDPSTCTNGLPVATDGVYNDTVCNAIVNSDGTIANPIFDNAHYVPSAVTGGSYAPYVSLSSTTAIAPGTKMQYLNEWVFGVEREIGKGVVVNVRYVDRRLKRIVEDMAALSPEAYLAGLTQQYMIANPSAGLDMFTNPIEIPYTSGAAIPAACGGANARYYLDPVQDTFGNTISPGAVCIVPGPYANGYGPGDVFPDGIPDGFVNPVRKYKAMEFELNKAFSSGWQLRTNYRWSQLSGNYEGAFRNDNQQADPSISSLFDFTQGDFHMLGDQFAVGWLNTDRRHIINSFFSYTFSDTFLKNLTLGSGVRVETGMPINDLKAHPAYFNSGEIPVNGRGSLGRTPTDGQADLHADYVVKMTEKTRLRFGADLFNVTNQRTQLRVDQNEDRSYGVRNLDFLKPVGGSGIGGFPGFQRPFYARFMLKMEF